MFELANYIVVNQVSANKKKASEVIKRHRHLIPVATNVNSYNAFNLAKLTGYRLFEGRFYRVPLTAGKKQEVSPMKALAVQLLNAVRDDNFELDEVSKIVEKDVALSVSLLRRINSQNFATEIKTIQHAAAMLGQKELRKWVSSTASARLGSDKPTEVNKVSLLRAKFAENLAGLFGLAMQADSLFLMGLFSILDVMLDVSIEEALTMVSVSDNIRKALVKHSGPFYPILEFIQYYEAADWTSVARYIILHNIEADKVYTSYIETIKWYSDLMHAIESADEEQEEGEAAQA